MVLTGLEEGAVIEYRVELDGEPVWPLDDASHPPSAIHTRMGEHEARLVLPICRVGAPEREPYTLSPTQHEHGFGVDALWAYARRLSAGSEPWPDGLLLIGDQVYADEVSPATVEFIRSRRDVSQPPGEEVADFEEYAHLYREAWSDPDIRWLLSTVPSAMIFDDHDVIDDWNIFVGLARRCPCAGVVERPDPRRVMSYWMLPAPRESGAAELATSPCTASPPPR